MRARSGSLCTSAKKCWRSSALALAAGAALLLLGSATSAQEQGADPNAPALRLFRIIPIDGTAGNPATRMFSFDISFWDPTSGLYVLGDRSNAALDIVDTTGKFTGTPDTLYGQIGANPGFTPGFAGDTGTTATSGPNGVAIAPNIPCIFAGDSPSRVVSFNYSVSFTTAVSAVSTGGLFRADEMAFDPKDNLLFVVNNADTPPYGTLIKVSSSCALSPLKYVIFTGANGINATNGAEQPVWDPTTNMFYISIPEINGPGGGGPNGGVAGITTSGAIATFFPINFCQPSGLALGPNDDLLVQCTNVFDATGKVCTTVVPGSQSKPVGVPATCTGIARPQVVVCNPSRGCTGPSLVSVSGPGGGDEAWFNPGDGNYYITAGNNPVGPSFAVVASVVNTFNQQVPTLPPVPQLTPGKPPSAGTVHSIAASAQSNHVYVPLPANTDYTDSLNNNCTQGCIAVFSAQ